MLFSVGGGRYRMIVFLEDTAKIIAVGKANALGNLGDGKVCVDQKPLGTSHAVAVEVIDGRRSHILAKTAVHVIDRQIHKGRQILLGNA